MDETKEIRKKEILEKVKKKWVQKYYDALYELKTAYEDLCPELLTQSADATPKQSAKPWTDEQIAKSDKIWDQFQEGTVKTIAK